jgi:hypothetical protein
LSWIFEKKIKTEENKMVIADVNTKNWNYLKTHFSVLNTKVFNNLQLKRKFASKFSGCPPPHKKFSRLSWLVVMNCI